MEESLVVDDFWEILHAGIFQAVQSFDISRKNEWVILQKDIVSRVEKISILLWKVALFEPARIERIRTRISSGLENFTTDEAVDKNRFEQEIVYYLEQLDFTEEKIRLDKHCRYFQETMEADGSIGKKLDFIAQEMGREINTLGSKARDADIQKLVVQMKDELEKIKEQTMNIL